MHDQVDAGETCSTKDDCYGEHACREEVLPFTHSSSQSSNDLHMRTLAQREVRGLPAAARREGPVRFRSTGVMPAAPGTGC